MARKNIKKKVVEDAVAEFDISEPVDENLILLKEIKALLEQIKILIEKLGSGGF